MRTVRQPQGSSLCVAACLAMILDTSLNAILSRVHLRYEGDTEKGHLYLPMKEVVRVLYEEGFAYGGGLVFEQPLTAVDEVIQASVTLRRPCDALVSVKSVNHKDALHMVVWDWQCQVVRDPQKDGYQNLSHYQIVEWGSVVPLNEI